MHVAVKELTQAVHDASGIRVLHRPGDQFAQDAALPEGVPWRWAVAEVPDPPAPPPGPAAPVPVPAAAVEAPAEPAGDGGKRPLVNAPRAAWAEYALLRGADPAAVDEMTKQQLLDAYRNG